MRIIIESDGMQTALGNASTADLNASGSGAANLPANGGAGPHSESGSEAADGSAVTDAGPPPDWLLTAVAEAEGRTTDPARTGDTTRGAADGGAAPDA
jgi:hypothetical protein